MKIKYIIGILIIWGLISCSDRDENQEPTYGKVNVALSVTLPEPENVHSLARSYTDCEIKNVDVLVFDEDGKFMERVKVDGGESLCPPAAGRAQAEGSIYRFPALHPLVMIALAQQLFPLHGLRLCRRCQQL